MVLSSFEARIGSSLIFSCWSSLMVGTFAKHIFAPKLAVSHMANGRCMNFNLRKMRFPVHRLILASGSEQLGALLNGHFSEGDQAGTREIQFVDLG